MILKISIEHTQDMDMKYMELQYTVEYIIQSLVYSIPFLFFLIFYILAQNY